MTGPQFVRLTRHGKRHRHAAFQPCFGQALALA